MNNKLRAAILDSHGIAYSETDNILLVLDEAYTNGVYQAEWLDITEWSFQQLKEWLGY